MSPSVFFQELHFLYKSFNNIHGNAEYIDYQSSYQLIFWKNLYVYFALSSAPPHHLILRRLLLWVVMSFEIAFIDYDLKHNRIFLTMIVCYTGKQMLWGTQHWIWNTRIHFFNKNVTHINRSIKFSCIHIKVLWQNILSALLGDLWVTNIAN